MEHYVGLDVSLKETHFCVLDDAGAVVARGREATHPELPTAALAAVRPVPVTPILSVMKTP